MKTLAVGCLWHGAIFVVFLWFLKGLGFRVDTNKRVDRFTADYIHGGYQYCPLLSIGVLLALGRQPASCALVIYSIH